MGTSYQTRLIQCGYFSVFVCSMLFSGFCISAAHASSCSDYAATPPFLTASLKPNVVFMLDNSWSMKYPIYPVGNVYDPGKKYYGLFDATKQYAYNDSIPVDTTSFDGHAGTSDTPGAPYDLRDGSKDKKILIDTSAKGAFVEDTSSCTPGPGNNCWEGNFLNWMTTRRIDAARKVLVGGKVETRSGFDYLGNGGKTWKIVGNNEPADDPQPISKSYGSSQNQSPFPNSTTFNIYSPAYYGGKKRPYTDQNIDLYDPYAKIEPLNVNLPFLLRDKSGAVIGEIGTVTTEDWIKTVYWGNIPKSVKLAGTYKNPVIVAKPPTLIGDNPSTIRINYNPDDKTQFMFWMDEWEYEDVLHFYETMTYMVLEQGTHTLPGTDKDLKIVAGSTNISGNLNADLIDKKTNSWQTIDIGTSQLANVPVVIASVTSINDPTAVTTRIKQTSKKDFMIALQREEKDVRIHSSETVHYIAMEPGLTAGSTQLKAGTEPDFNHDFKNLNFTDIPAKAFVADMQTTNDAEPASLRYISLSTSWMYQWRKYQYGEYYGYGLDSLKANYNSFVDRLKVEEEGSNDSETKHGNETVGYIAVASPIYNIAVLNNSEPKGLFQQIEKKVRIGLSCYRYTYDSNIYSNNELTDGGTLRLSIPNNPFVKDNAHISNYRKLDTHVKADIDDIIDGVEHYPLVFGTTPLAENLYEVGRYFSQVSPYYENKPCIKFQSSQSECEKDYVLDETWDPYTYKDSKGEYKGMGCAKSFVIVLTDGEPYYDHNVPTNDKDLSVKGNTLDTVAESLYGGGKKDLRSDLDDNQYLEVSTIALANATIPDILKATAKKANGTAHAAEDGEQLEKALNSAITLIENQTSAGASLSLLSEKATAGSIINQALLFPEKTFKEGDKNYIVDWISTINAFWFYNPSNNKNITGISDMRENTTYEKYQDYALDIYDDRALDFKLDLNGSLIINAYNINRGGKLDGAPDEYSAFGKNKGPAVTYNNIDDVKKIFDIGKILKDRGASDRKVYGVGKDDKRVAFTQRNESQFVEKFKLPSSPTSADIPACLGAVSSPARSDEKKAIANNLISYIRGESDDFTSQKKITGNKNIEEQCRSRKVDSKGNIWKLGDIIYSTPRLVDYSLKTKNEKFSRLYTGANDGMLHAFKIGELRKGDVAKNNQAAVLCDSNDKGACDHVTLGAEAWTFIPKNALPYLKYLADPNYQHIYTVDLPPYLIRSGDKQILIGGMRFGGATGCTKTNSKNKKFWCGDVNQDGIIDTDIDEDAIQTVPPGATPHGIADDNLGLSSYFALDITDPDDPKFLWEFTDPAMGFSFSGPAFITRKKANNVDKYVMFLSGPLSNKGGAAPGQDLKIFILKLDPETFAITETFKLDGMGKAFTKVGELSGHDQAFGGRLFTNGIDSNDDGSTDVIFFGVNNLVDKRWQGNVLLVAPTDDDPVSNGSINWEFGKVFGKVFDESETFPPPITNRVGHGVCYDNNYIFFGSGRWFHKFDSRGDEREGERNYLWGIEIDKCLEALFDKDDHPESRCDTHLNTRKHDEIIELVTCPDRVKSADEISWRETLDGKDDKHGFLMERAISDPTFMSNMALFTTAEPSAGGCDYGGQFRTWGFNCRTGHSLFSKCITITKPAGTLLLQGSGGNIKSGRIEADTFRAEGKDLKATEWIPGIPEETGPQFVPAAGKLDGEIILWIER